MKFTKIFIIIWAFVAACSEEKTPEPFTFSRNFTGQVSKTWKITFVEETLNGEIIDSFTISCAADDRYTFYANSERLFEVSTGSNRCYEDPEPSLITDTWSYKSSTATLTMLLPFFLKDQSLPFIVREVKKNKLEVEIFLDETATSSYRVHFDVVNEK